MAFYQLYYHIVWATKYRAPTITAEIESILFDLIRSKAFGLGGFVYALNGAEDHVHLAGSIPPKISVSRFMGQVKGVSSARYNNEFRNENEPRFYWQDSYGIFSFDKKRLPYVVQYVEGQKEHHARQKLIPILERDEPLETPSTQLSESTEFYVTNYDEWFESMLDF